LYRLPFDSGDEHDTFHQQPSRIVDPAENHDRLERGFGALA